MSFTTTTLQRAFTTSLLTAAVAFGSILTVSVQSQAQAQTQAQTQTLNGAGATFPAPLYERYAREVRKRFPDLRINYQAIGSGGGIRQMIAGTVDFGGSDAAMTDSEIGRVKNGVILVPTAGGAVSVVYNLPGVNNLRLSRETLPAIFSGQITNWNDPKIRSDNPGVNLPNQPIRFVVRADGSGTTFIFTNHLSAISPYFRGRVGTSTAPRWNLPNVLSGRGNPGVAALVNRTPGAIGYVEYSFATQNNLRSALVQNRTGQFIAPSLQTANAALASVTFPDNFRTFVDDPAQGYPIVGLTWMMVNRQYANPAKADAVRRWINWVLTDGQKINPEMNYTSIPPAVVNRVLQTVNNNVR